MPMYLFENPETGEVVEVFFHMNDEKSHTDDSGVEWKRLYGNPQLSTHASIDPWNNNDFVNKTADMKGTVGDLLDRSAELSAKRAEQHDGVDPVKQKYFNKYSEERHGAKHQKDRARIYESKNVKIEFDD